MNDSAAECSEALDPRVQVGIIDIFRGNLWNKTTVFYIWKPPNLYKCLFRYSSELPSEFLMLDVN